MLRRLRRKRPAKEMKSRMIAECVLDELLSNVSEGAKTSRLLYSMVSLIATDVHVAKMCSVFVQKVKRDPTYLSRCSCFHKRILLFIVLQCVFLGDDITYTFTKEKLSPLENALVRLSDVAIAFEKEINHEVFCDVWVQTIKQAILMFLKNGQTVEASKILVIHRDKIRKRHRRILEELVYLCSENHRNLDSLIADGHDYTLYWTFICGFVEGLNRRLDDSIVTRVLQTIHTSLDHTPNMSDEEEQGPSASTHIQNDLLAGNSAENIDVPEEDETEEFMIDGQDTVVNNQVSEKHDLDSDSDACSASYDEVQSGKVTKCNYILKTRKPEENHDEGYAQNKKTDLESSEGEGSDTSKAEPINLFPLNPKNSLSYRMRKQAVASSGIITPCQHIVSHCRYDNGDSPDDSRPTMQKARTSTPIRGSQAKPMYKNSIPPRNLLLGDRFEGVSTEGPSTSGRSYTGMHRKKFSFNIELDSYIIAGCQRFGIGRWSQILQAFPFPPACTNTKIKDRFRILVKWNYVAILDDGDFNVLNDELKVRVADAQEKNAGEPMNRSVTRRAERSSSSHRANPTSIPQGHRKKKDRDSDEVTVMSMTSQSDPDIRKIKSPKFRYVEDAYIVCGVRYLGFRWLVIKKNFDFSKAVTASDVRQRWLHLLRKKMVTIDDEGIIRCRDPDLEDFSRDARKILKNNIQKLRKSFFASTSYGIGLCENEDSDDSFEEAPEPSFVKYNNASPEEEDEDAEIFRRIEREILADSPQKSSPVSRGAINRHRREDEEVEDFVRWRKDPVDNPPRLKFNIGNNGTFNKEFVTKKAHKKFDESVDDTDRDLQRKKPRQKKSTSCANVSMRSDAGTQTKRRKLLLGGPSPAVLEASDSATGSSEETNAFQVGSPIRPSRLNLFKRKAVNEPVFEGSQRKVKPTPARLEARSKREREFLRMQRRKVQTTKQAWSEEEISQLLAGLSKHGPGKWSEILDDGWEVFKDRTSVMIKDKFRTMLRNGDIPEDLVLLHNATKAAKE